MHKYLGLWWWQEGATQNCCTNIRSLVIDWIWQHMRVIQLPSFPILSTRTSCHSSAHSIIWLKFISMTSLRSIFNSSSISWDKPSKHSSSICMGSDKDKLKWPCQLLVCTLLFMFSLRQANWSCGIIVSTHLCLGDIWLVEWGLLPEGEDVGELTSILSEVSIENGVQHPVWDSLDGRVKQTFSLCGYKAKGTKAAFAQSLP